MTSKEQMPSAPEPDPATRERELRSLMGELVRPPTMARLENWISQAVDDRTKFMTDTIWGAIRWQKSLGRSLGPTLASGFRVEHSFHERKDGGVRPDGIIIDNSKWIQLPAPTVWDMPDNDDDHHQVSYMCWAKRPWVNAVAVHFSDEQPWNSPLYVRLSSTFKSIVPPDQKFWMLEANHVILDECGIVEVPIRFFG